MDAFALIVIGGLIALFVGILLLGLYHPRSGAEVLDWKPTRSPELEAQNEVDDLDQMLEATNRMRKRRGADELTFENIQEKVDDDRRKRDELRERNMAGDEVRQMLEAKNARRRHKGEPELSEAQFREQLDADRAAAGLPPLGENAG